MWLYIPASFLSAPASEDSISESDWRFQALERSVSWRGSTRSARSWRLAWTRGRLTTHLFTRISEPSMADRGVAAWISSLPDTLASLSRLRGSGEERRTSATSGPRSCESLARWDRASSSWRTSQATFGWDSTEFSETLPTSGSMRSGALYGRPTLERLTDESGSSCWPTATTQDNAQVAGQYATNGTTLAGAAKQWPTPAACVPQDGEDPETWLKRRELLKQKKKNGNGAGLPLTIAGVVFTANGRLDLTPTGKRSPNTSGLRLNPRFVEWLMGFPDGWTVCAPSATPLSPNKPRTHSGDS